MHVVAGHYHTREKEENTFLEMISLEMRMNAQQSGMSHYNLLRNKKEPNKFCIIEFWLQKSDRDKYEQLDSHLYFLSLLEGVLDGEPDFQVYEMIK